MKSSICLLLILYLIPSIITVYIPYGSNQLTRASRRQDDDSYDGPMDHEESAPYQNQDDSGTGTDGYGENDPGK